MLLAASPGWMPPPLLAAGLIWNPNIRAFRSAVAGSGQEGAPLAAADELLQTERFTQRVIPSRTFAEGSSNPSVLQDSPPPVLTASNAELQPAPDPGRANVISCAGYLPGDPNSCGWVTDPRGAGLAVGSN